MSESHKSIAVCTVFFFFFKLLTKHEIPEMQLACVMAEMYMTAQTNHFPLYVSKSEPIWLHIWN